MVPILARQSIDRKIKQQLSVIVGDYEFYYAIGILTTFLPLDVDGTTKADIVKAKALEAMKNYTPKNPGEEFLLSRIHRYEPHPDEWDETMNELFCDGQTYGMPEEFR
ncbi:MAG: DUF3837 domain-containing protein [Lachnospiraceae bacterium]|nr:DUF3837 domain-containing protein [Lachnospiraceae bacterium]